MWVSELHEREETFLDQGTAIVFYHYLLFRRLLLNQIYQQPTLARIILWGFGVLGFWQPGMMH